MAIVSAKWLKLAEAQDRHNLFTIQVANLDEDCQENFNKSRAKELRIAMLKLQGRSRKKNMPIPTVDAAQKVPPPVTVNASQPKTLPSKHSFHAPLDFSSQDPHQIGLDVNFAANLAKLDQLLDHE
ncbi:unnamed protein product [Calypogeia fissa]